MDIKELKEAKEVVVSLYEHEKPDLINKNDSISIAKTKNYEKEINKLDQLVSIYEHDDIDYKVMKLERLYMQNISNLTKEEFNNLSMDQKFEIYYNSFPKKWSTTISLEEKLNYLEDAIIDNDLIKVKDNSLIRKK